MTNENSATKGIERKECDRTLKIWFDSCGYIAHLSYGILTINLPAHDVWKVDNRIACRGDETFESPYLLIGSEAELIAKSVMHYFKGVAISFEIEIGKIESISGKGVDI